MTVKAFRVDMLTQANYDSGVMSEILQFMAGLDYSLKEAAEIFGIQPGRLQNWADSGHVSFTPRELGPRRLLRRFDGHDLVLLGTMIELFDGYGLPLTAAKHIAAAMSADVCGLIMK